MSLNVRDIPTCSDRPLHKLTFIPLGSVDLHALLVIGSSGYQKCISYLWRGWLVQDDKDPSSFIEFKKKANEDYWSHFDPDRMRAPMYQNAVQIFFSILYLVLYTFAINTINSTGDLDIVEGVVYIMTASFIFDEVAKFWKGMLFHTPSQTYMLRAS